mgnify:CR=1 FL=1
MANTLTEPILFDIDPGLPAGTAGHRAVDVELCHRLNSGSLRNTHPADLQAHLSRARNAGLWVVEATALAGGVAIEASAWFFLSRTDMAAFLSAVSGEPASRILKGAGKVLLGTQFTTDMFGPATDFHDRRNPVTVTCQAWEPTEDMFGQPTLLDALAA